MTYEEWRRRRKALYAMFDDAQVGESDSCPYCEPIPSANDDLQTRRLIIGFHNVLGGFPSEWVAQMSRCGDILLAEHDR